MSANKCDQCNGDRYMPITCCSGYMCCCQGQPMGFESCDKCNPDGKQEPGDELMKTPAGKWHFGGYEVRMNDHLEKRNQEDDEILLANINHELLSGVFGITRIQRVFQLGYNRASRLVDRAIESGVFVRHDDLPYKVRISDEMRKK